jgi:hypothetical protein
VEIKVEEEEGEDTSLSLSMNVRGLMQSLMILSIECPRLREPHCTILVGVVEQEEKRKYGEDLSLLTFKAEGK